MSDGSVQEEAAMPTTLTGSSIDDAFGRIDNLIAAVKEKSSASEADRRKFEHSWLGLADREGLSEEVLLRLYRGLTIDAAMPFYLYAQKTDSGESYQAFLTSELFLENKAGSSFKMALDLFGLEIVRPTSADSLAAICRSLQKVAYNKDGNLYGFAEGCINKYLVKRMANQTCPGLGLDLELSPEEAAGLAAVLSDQLKLLGMKSNVRSSERDAIIKLMGWLQDLKSDSEAISMAQAEIEPHALEKSPDAQHATEKQESAAEPIQETQWQDADPQEGTDSEDCSIASSGMLSMDSVIGFLHSYSEEHASLKNEVLTLRSQLGAAKSADEHDESVVISLQDQLAEEKQRVAELEAAVSALTTEKEELENRMASLKKDGDSAREMLSLMDRDHERQSNEQLKRLSSELRIEYQDFKDAENLPMDVDLGENMRLQIQSIFKILQKHGLEF